MQGSYQEKGEKLMPRISAILIGLVFIYGGCAILSLTGKDKPLKNTLSEAEKDGDKDYYKYFELKDAIISPIIYSDTVDKNKTEIFIGILSPERWTEAKKNLRINGNDSDAASKLLNSDFKPSFFYLAEVSKDTGIDENYFVSRIGDPLKVEGNKFSFDARPEISGYLNDEYENKLPILIEEAAPTGTRLKGFGIILIGIVVVVIPVRTMYKNFMDSDPNYVT